MTDSNAGQRYATDFIPGHTEQAVLLGNPIVDRLVSTIIEVGAELWTQRRRLMALERVLESHGISASSAIEQAVPRADEVAADRAARDALVDRIYGPLLAALKDEAK